MKQEELEIRFFIVAAEEIIWNVHLSLKIMLP